MIIQILFAVLAGVLTIGAPCILPVLPILLGASVGQTSRQRPLLIVLGFIVSFSAVSLLLSAIISSIGLNPNLLRDIAIGLLLIFGGLMIWPKPFELLTVKLSGTINRANQISKGDGNMSGLLLGLVLGIIWTPCAGPVLGSILTLVATQGSTAKSAVLMVAYALGAGIPMLVIAYGSQWITTKIRWASGYATRLQQIFGVLIVGLAVAMFFQYDITVENALVAYCPAVASSFEQKLAHIAGLDNPTKSTSGQINTVNNLMDNAPQNNLVDKPMQKIEFQNYGPAPEFSGISHWLNSDPLTMQDLRGKAVLVDFWTYSCINCIRTLPYITKWYDKYKDQGLIVIGVHTPEFAFEKVTDNVQTAMNRFGIHYPVAQDNDYATWNAYNNQYWPAEYLIDQSGKIVYEHFGEGEYDHTENAIRQLLNLNSAVPKDDGQDLSGVGSPEMYFELPRLQNLSSAQNPNQQPTSYSLPTSQALNTFALEGTWQFDNEKASLLNGPGKIRLHYRSKNVYMVAAADEPITITLSVDGKKTGTVTIQASELYDLVKSDTAGEHVLDIEIPTPGFKAFTFTFG